MFVFPFLTAIFLADLIFFSFLSEATLTPYLLFRYAYFKDQKASDMNNLSYSLANARLSDTYASEDGNP